VPRHIDSIHCRHCGGIRRPAVAAVGLCYCDDNDDELPFDDDELGIDPEEEYDA